MHRKILKDLSKDELLNMRESGMTNTDIANALDISYASVYRLIGKQPSSMRCSPHAASVIPKAPLQVSEPAKKQESEPEHDAALVVEDRHFKLAGLYANYGVHVKDKTIDVFTTDDGVTLTLKFDEVGVFANELAAIARQTSRLRVGCEAW